MEHLDAATRSVYAAPPRAPFVCKDADDQMSVDYALAHRARLQNKERAVPSMRKRLSTLGVWWRQPQVSGRAWDRCCP